MSALLPPPQAGLPWVVLGVAGSKRVRGLQAAGLGLGLAPPRLVEWSAFLRQPALLRQALQAPCRLRIEPPGDDATAQLRLMQLGCRRLRRPACRAPEHGELLGTDAWFAGFARVLRGIARLLARRPQVQAFHAPADILAMTDKLHCQQRLQAHGVHTPLLLGACEGYEHLQALMHRHGLDRAYLKARYGSSAAGVVAYRRNRRGQEQAISSARLVDGPHGPQLFNIKRVHCYSRQDEIRRLLDQVAAQQAYAEAWLPKPRCGAGHYDLRVLTFGGRAAHRVARIGERAMTNLHLDNQRADPAALLDATQLQAVQATAERAAGAFPHSHMIGFDLVACARGVHVLEANAFGDLLPGLLWQGEDPHQRGLRWQQGPQ
ncbi:STM4014 family protein [Eleftheria terrae]|uniref:STM4014 family protein n=1 Tax=Eleftheria terrae TaxID=1597781 RepID=UPI00263B93C0|nr:STM4014 family protein [Eleftheria terrae]WKB51844.1 STM4014 family protein [Eleftheria terrae]